MREFLIKAYRFSSSWTGTVIIVLFLIFFVIQSFVIPSGSMKNTLLIGDFLFAQKFVYGVPIPKIPWIELPIVPDFNNNGHLIEGDKPERGDIVIFLYPKNPKVHYVKRCVAKGGDEIIYQDKHLYIHFKEGDEYIKRNYPPEKIKRISKQLWVDNPYMDRYSGIHYTPEAHENIFNILIKSYLYGEDGIDLNPIYAKELGGDTFDINGRAVNALYKRVEEGHYYMIGDNRDNSNDSRFWGSIPYSLVIGKPWFIYFSWDSEKSEVRWDRVATFVKDLEKRD
ncbi:MAG: signal peptidase I [Epsilonproteobacteria bacterium]|nr:signal peptidase I [Campylobacterota bacterium]